MNVQKRSRKQHGAILTEYMLLTFLIAIFLITALGLFGEQVSSTMRSSTDTVQEEFDS